MRILITGATGFVGGHVLQALMQRDGVEAVAAVRSPQKLRQLYPHLRVIPLDAARATEQHLRDLLQGVDVVINCIGIIAESGNQRFQSLHIDFPCRLFQASQRSGVRRIVHLSALGADKNARSQFHRSKYRAEHCMHELDIESVVIKPSLVFGAGGASMRFFAALAAQPLQVLFGQGTHRVQPVDIHDLTETIVRAATMTATPPHEIAVVGPTPMSFRAMLLAYRRWLGYGKLRTLSIPWPLALCGARLVGRISPWLSEDNLLMLKQGNTGDVSTLKQVLRREPRALDEVLQPGSADDADRWHARLFLLLPALRMSVAFVWIYTGLTSLFFYPHDDSYAMLSEIGLTGSIAVLALYGAAVLDIALGISVLLRWHVVLCGVLQLAIIAGYTVLISAFLPAFWLHPFGPISKNIPFIVAIMILMAVEIK